MKNKLPKATNSYWTKHTHTNLWKVPLNRGCNGYFSIVVWFDHFDIFPFNSNQIASSMHIGWSARLPYI